MLGFILTLKRYWKLVLVACLFIGFGLQTFRLNQAINNHKEYILTEQVVNAKAQVDASKKSEEGIVNYVNQEKKDSPAVIRVITRFDNIILRIPDPMSGVTDSAGNIQGASTLSEDYTEREFLEDARDDLQVCNTQLNRFREGRDILYRILPEKN